MEKKNGCSLFQSFEWSLQAPNRTHVTVEERKEHFTLKHWAGIPNCSRMPSARLAVQHFGASEPCIFIEWRQSS